MSRLIFKIYWATKKTVLQQNKRPYQKCIHFNIKNPLVRFFQGIIGNCMPILIMIHKV